MPAKKNPYSGPSEKVIGLFSLLLFTGRSHSLGQLALALQCSKQTILRMIEQIERSRWLPIDSWTEGREKYYQTRKNTKLPNVTLDADALGKLLLCFDMVRHMLPETYRKEVTRALQGATTLLPHFEEREGALASYTQVKPKGMIDYTGKETLISSLIRAIRERKICTITYCGPRHKTPRLFTVAPYQVVAFHEGLYLRCRPESMIRSGNAETDMILAVHRMQNVVPGDQRFKKIEMDKDADKLAGTFGLTQGAPFQVSVKVSANAAAYVRERIWSDDQEITEREDGSIVLRFTTTSEQETVAWVLSFGGEMELVSPGSLRKVLGRRAAAVAAGHRSPESEEQPNTAGHPTDSPR